MRGPQAPNSQDSVRFLKLIITESFSGLSANARWSLIQRWAQGWSWRQSAVNDNETRRSQKPGGNRAAIFRNGRFPVVHYSNHCWSSSGRSILRRGAICMRGTSNNAHALNGFHERPSLLDTLHSHIGHNHLHSWLTGGRINTFFESLKGLALNIYFLKMGSDPRPCVKRW